MEAKIFNNYLREISSLIYNKWGNFMFDYKEELSKFQPLPEPEEAQKTVENNDVEDIMDLLRKLSSRTTGGEW